MLPCDRLILSTLALVLVLFATYQPALAQTGGCEEIGEEWFGIWETSVVLTDCESGLVFDELTNTDKICADDCLDIVGDVSECSTVIDGNTISTSCSGTTPLTQDCGVTIELEVQFVIDGTGILGGGRQSLSYVGDCPPELQDACLDLEYSAQRIGGPVACLVSTAPISWSLLKGAFR